MGFAGFDSLAYPGDVVMAWLKANTNLRFVGFYLAPAPSRPSSAWMSRRGVLAQQGWGFAPVYVGQQEGGGPGQHNLSSAQGDVDGRDASQLMQAAGFPTDSVVYLDCETGGAASPATTAYFSAWVDALTSVGQYRAGVYCSHTTAASLLGVRPNVSVWTFNLSGIGVGPGYPPNLPANDPSGSGVEVATIWQHSQNLAVALHGGPVAQLKVDLDCASVPDPSQPAPIG